MRSTRLHIYASQPWTENVRICGRPGGSAKARCPGGVEGPAPPEALAFPLRSVMPRLGGEVSTAGRTRPYQGRSSWHLSRPQRRHKELRPMSSRRRTCGGRQHRPRSDQPDRRWLHGPPGVPDDRIAACAAGSPWPPPVIYAPWASQHRRACRKDNASSETTAAFRLGTLSSSNPGGLIRRLPSLTALRMPAGSFGFREASASATDRVGPCRPALSFTG